MKRRSGGTKRRLGATFKRISLDRYFNWPSKRAVGEWWQKLVQSAAKYPQGAVKPWGIPFLMAQGRRHRVILVAKGQPEVTIKAAGRADFVCLLHEWCQIPETLRNDPPAEGLVVAEYELAYADGSRHVQPVRARFEVAMKESVGPPWLAVPFNMWQTVDPANPPPGMAWGHAQQAARGMDGSPLVYAMRNPHPEKRIRSLTIRGLQESPLLVAGLTLYQGASHPLRHLPRRTYRVATPSGPPLIGKAELDLGGVARIERTKGPRGEKWLKAGHAGLNIGKEPEVRGESLIEAFGSEDATVTVALKGGRRPLKFSLGEAFRRGQVRDDSGTARLEVLGQQRQWMRVIVKDSSTGKPAPVRVHFSGSRGEYIAPYGHHAQINTGWFMDYGADVVANGRNFAYVPGEFTTDLPVGDIYVEICKGFEYQPVRRKLTIQPGQELLELRIDRRADWRALGWVTADTHVHFLSPQTAWLEAQCEGVNVVNLLASQWGRLFTNVGDLTGKVGVAEDDTLVYVGTENRNHMLGHMSMLGTKGLPVYPMCAGGPSEAWVGDPDFVTMAEWARENRRKGGLVIRPHFPWCGNTEDPVPVLKGLVDALEIGMDARGEGYPVQEWYRYLNCGCRVAVVGGTDKMSAGCPLGWRRTYALLDTRRPFDYENWADAVRTGRTFASSGPLIDMQVDGRRVGDSLQFSASGGTVEVHAAAESVWPLGKIEIVHNGRVVAAEQAERGARTLRARASLNIGRSGWIAARCSGWEKHPGAYVAAHTSPVYLKCGDTRPFDGPAAQHMLALVEGGIEYLQTLATVFDEASRNRMVKLFQEAQQELKGRLLVERPSGLHHGRGPYHTHGYEARPEHHHA